MSNATTVPEAAKTWLPSELQDEEIPTPRATPNAWIRRVPDNIGKVTRWALELGEQADQAARYLEHGEVVNFQWHAALGQRELTVTDGGNFALPEPIPQPPGADVYATFNGCEPCHIDYLKDMIADYSGRPGDTMTLDIYCWSADIPFTFHEGAFHAK